MIILGKIAGRSNRRFCIYSQVNFQFLLSSPARTSCCSDQSEIWT